MSVTDLDDHRPHLVVACADFVRVVPVSLALDWAAGVVDLPEPAVLRKIIAEWLMCVKAGCVEHAQAEAAADEPPASR